MINDTFNDTVTLPEFVMESGGRYDLNSLPQNRVNEQLAALLTSEVDALLDGERNQSITSTFEFADYGCSTGKNSIRLLTPAIEILLDRMPECVVNVARCDLPSNDFNQLALNINDSTRSHPRFFESMIARSFNKQLCSSDKIDLGVCSLALHWLEDSYVECHSISPEFTEQESVFQNQWRKQMINFLSIRQREIKTNGSLFIAHLNRQPGESTKHGPFRLIDDAIARLKAQKEDDCVLPIYRPTHDELTTLVNQVNLPMELVADYQLTHRHPLFDKTDVTFSQKKIAKRYVNFVLAFAGPFLNSRFSKQFNFEKLKTTMLGLVSLCPVKYEPKNGYSILQLKVC